jgi:protein-S-isoprenylcysteine O-methyltransferase Ste14
MADRPGTLEYSRNERRRIAPTRNDWYVALFVTIAAIAGLIGVVGISSMIFLWINLKWLDQPELLPWWVIVVGFLFYGGALTLAYFAGRLARRRVRPAG